MHPLFLKDILRYLIAGVWLANGAFCKLFSMVPRHEWIVSRILGNEFSHQITLIIGVAEIILALWVLSKYRNRLCIFIQIIVILSMNIIELMCSVDLLLFGKLNIIFALCFCLVILWQAHLKET